MNREEFQKVQANYAETGFPGICDRASAECLPNKLATKMWSQVTKEGEEIFLFCHMHAPKNALPLHQMEVEILLPKADVPVATAAMVSPDNSPPPRDAAESVGFDKLRFLLNQTFGIRLQSTGDAATPHPVTCVVMQTLDASPANPYLVEFNQFILDPFTGPGQFDLVQRDAIRRVSDGASAGATAVLTSATMNWQTEDVGELIRVGRRPSPGRWYSILSRQSSTQVTLSGNIILPSVGLALTMDGRSGSAVTIATKAGLTDGVTTSGGHSRLSKILTSDKVYSVVFVPGTAGDGIFSISAREAGLPTQQTQKK